MLHIVNKSATERGSLESCLAMATKGSAVLLIEDAVYAVTQGGTAADVAPGFDEQGLGAVVNNSRGIIFAHASKQYKDRFGEARWQAAVEAATCDMIEQLRAETSVGRL